MKTPMHDITYIAAQIPAILNKLMYLKLRRVFRTQFVSHTCLLLFIINIAIIRNIFIVSVISKKVRHIIIINI